MYRKRLEGSLPLAIESSRDAASEGTYFISHPVCNDNRRAKLKENNQILSFFFFLKNDKSHFDFAFHIIFSQEIEKV